MIAHVVSACDEHVAPPGVAVAVNDRIAPPPSLLGMFQATIKDPADGVTATERGALGTVVAEETGFGVAVTGVDETAPPLFCAATVMV